MNRLIYIVLITLISAKVNLAQQFVPGYYIINSSAEYTVAMPSGMDYRSNKKVESGQLQMAKGEVVIVFEKKDGRYYSFDPNGRMIVLQGNNCITKAPMIKNSGVGYMLETIPLIDGNQLGKGSFYWIIGQDVGKGTVKIQVQDAKTYDVPQDKIMLYGAMIKNEMKSEFYQKVH
jgi:hypothetical protein